jgi:hypothetical protein
MDDSGDRVATFLGKSLDEMSRDELIQAVHTLASALNDAFDRHHDTLALWQTSIDARRRRWGFR